MKKIWKRVCTGILAPVSYTHLDVYKRQMGAHVMVMARRKQARCEAAELGYETVDFNDPAKACFETLFLINTVPDRVIDESLIMILQKDAIIIDIASKPGGCDFEACKRYRCV